MRDLRHRGNLRERQTPGRFVVLALLEVRSADPGSEVVTDICAKCGATGVPMIEGKHMDQPATFCVPCVNAIKPFLTKIRKEPK